MTDKEYISRLLGSALIVTLALSRSHSQEPNLNPNSPRRWNYGDRSPLTGNQGNFYNPIFANNGNGSRGETNWAQPPPQSLPGPQNSGSAAKPRPVYSPYPWNFQPSSPSNKYSVRPQAVNSWTSHPHNQNQIYTTRPQQGIVWATKPSYLGYTSRPILVNSRTPSTPAPSFTPSPPRWPSDRSLDQPSDDSNGFDLMDFESLPGSYKTAFMSVEDLVRNKGIISPPGPNSQNVVVVFNDQTQQILNTALAPMVANILPTLVPGTWRSMTFVQGCCSALRYHAANETLVNMNGQQKKIVHFSKYNPPMYQFIPHGICAQESYSTNGHCFQGMITMTLLVYDLRFNPPLSFDVFSIPSYCNCAHY